MLIRSVTAGQFRRVALQLAGVCESAHMDHPDFRAAGRIFATLGYPNQQWGMVKLKPEQQREFVRAAPDVFKPCAGAWGRKGATSVHLRSVSVSMLKAALKAAWQNVRQKGSATD